MHDLEGTPCNLRDEAEGARRVRTGNDFLLQPPDNIWFKNKYIFNKTNCKEVFTLSLLCVVLSQRCGHCRYCCSPILPIPFPYFPFHSHISHFFPQYCIRQNASCKICSTPFPGQGEDTTGSSECTHTHTHIVLGRILVMK